MLSGGKLLSTAIVAIIPFGARIFPRERLLAAINVAPAASPKSFRVVKHLELCVFGLLRLNDCLFRGTLDFLRDIISCRRYYLRYGEILVSRCWGGCGLAVFGCLFFTGKREYWIAD